MKTKSSLLYAILATSLSIASYGQGIVLEPDLIIEKRINKGENHLYTIMLKKGEHIDLVVMQKGVDLAVDIHDSKGQKIKTFDSPNGANGPELVAFQALQNGKYELHIYPLDDLPPQISDSIRTLWLEENQGDYSISKIEKISAKQYAQKLDIIQKDKDLFADWLRKNAQEIKTVDPGNGFEDLIPLKSVLQDVKVLGLGEATHGTSEFFRMKHRLLEFLVKEMGFTSFYIEASMSRCRYINDFVLYGKGDLDTATVIQGFWTWRVEEVREMIKWIRQYNSTMPDEKKVKFHGFDLQLNNYAWDELIKFYKNVNPMKITELDSARSAEIRSMNISYNAYGLNLTAKNAEIKKAAYHQCLAFLEDMTLNEGKYEFLGSKALYDLNLMNIKLIVQELKSYENLSNDRRDYYMAENILYLLNREKPGTKIIIWAHNGHISKLSRNINEISAFNQMGNYLAKVLNSEYYALGFEFYSGSFQTMNIDLQVKSTSPDVMTIGEPPVESLAWYFNNTGKNKFFIDFRNTGTNKIMSFTQPFEMHSLGSTYSQNYPATSSEHINNYDGMIFIKESSAAKDFNKVKIK